MRAVIYSMILPAVAVLDGVARSCGIEPVALIAPRPKPGATARLERSTAILADAPVELDVLFARDLASLERHTRACAPDLGLCTGFAWKLPAAVLAIPRLGVVNGHPSLLPRHRGPFPLAWAIREGDAEVALTYHLMDAEFDTGPVLAQGSRPMPSDTSFEGLAPTLRALSVDLLTEALQKLLAGDRGRPQPEEGATWAAPFGDDYAEIDWTRPAVEVDRQVRAWQWMFAERPAGPLTTIGGERVRVLETSLERPDDPEAVRMDAADAPVWVVAHVPA